MSKDTWRRWAYGREDRTFRDLFSPTVVGIVIVLGLVFIVVAFGSGR